MTGLARHLLDPGLILCAVLVAAFTGIAWHRFYQGLKADRKWRADRARYRAEAELAAKGYAVFPADVDPTSLLDDSPGPLPETFRAPCGELVRAGREASLLTFSRPDRKPRA